MKFGSSFSMSQPTPSGTKNFTARNTIGGLKIET